MKRICLSIFVIFYCISCSNDGVKPINKERPIETWVFRSVIDQNPRMLTVALHKDLYLSYFTQTGTLYKAWKGIVNLEGAVFDGAHGPQPTSVGDAYIIQDQNTPTWKITKGGEEIIHTYDYAGHRIVEGDLELMYNFSIEGNNNIRVYERVNDSKSESGFLEFNRIFRTEGMNSDEVISFTGFATVVDKSNIVSAGELILDQGKNITKDGAVFTKYQFTMQLKNNGSESVTIPVSKAMYEDPNIDDGFGEDVGNLPEGGVLISKHDCKTCHNKVKKTVGPSYISIAKKYEHTDENMMMLVNKIKKGGSGIWGEQVMTPHPEISNFDLKEMVSYIFTVADFEGKSSKDSKKEELTFEASDIDPANLIPGSVTRIYSIEPGTPKIPTDLEKLKPIQAGILQNFDNLSGGDFKELENDFALVSIGYLEIIEDGIYDFRIWSDDGSKMYLHDKLILDNDGWHGTEMKQGRLFLKKGMHPFKIEFFQGGGGRFLSWNYKPENEKFWAVIPTELISHDKKDQELVGLLKLPMSVNSKIPGDKYALDGVHPSFNMTQARPKGFNKKIGGMDFLPNGKLIVSCWDAEGGVYVIDNVDSGDENLITAKKIAQGLAEPLGVKVVDGRIFVMQKQEITELIDNNSDEIIDEYRTLCDSWGVSSNFHEFGFGLEEKDGYLYANLATGIQPGGAGVTSQHMNRGNCIKVSIQDGSIEFVANGLRTPNGIGLGYNDDLYIADNQGDWLPSSKILHVSKGAFFGSRAVDFEGTANLEEKKPVVWLPQDEIGNSPSTPSYLNVGPYKNQMIHGEVTHGGIKRVYVEEVEGQYQGAVFRFTQGLEGGINRITWGPDGALYAGGIGNPGNWQHTGTKWYGLQRLEYNKKPTFEMLSVNAKSNGIEITFTEPLKEGEGWQKKDYEIKQWYYLPTKDYGGPKLDERDLNIRTVTVSKDRTKVFLELGGMKEDHVVYVHLKNHFVSVNENSLWSTEAWYTMNRIPKNKPGTVENNKSPLRSNALTESEKSQGWELLFDGKSMDKFHTFNSESIDSKWIIDGDAIKFNSKGKGKGGDLVTNEEYENFEFTLEWKISNCGNSGIFFNVQEGPNEMQGGDNFWATYQSGPEMQILDNTCHPDTKFVTHRAGDLYDMIETKYYTVKPAGEWNKIRIVSDQGNMQFWQNGHKVVEFTMHDDSWNAMVAKSKFKDWKEFGKFKSGHLAVQDHGDDVWFRNIKIRKIY